MRNKEGSDYRDFPDPDLLPLEISEEEIKSIKSSILSFQMSLKINLLKLTNYQITMLPF